MLWVAKYAPTSLTPLPVSTQRIKALTQWIYTLSTTSGQVLVLEGPSGAGKSALVRVLLQENDIECVHMGSKDTLKDFEDAVWRMNRYRGMNGRSSKPVVLVIDEAIIPSWEHSKYALERFRDIMKSLTRSKYV